MNLHLTAAATVAQQQARNQRLSALGGLALALTLAAGIGAWTTAGQRDATRSTPVSLAIAAENAEVSAVGRSSDRSLVYIARSQQDAELIERFALELDGAGTVSGRRYRTPDVLVTDFDVATIARVSPGASGKAFVDLRTP